MKTSKKLLCTFTALVLISAAVFYLAAGALPAKANTPGEKIESDMLKDAVVMYLGSPRALVKNSEKLVDPLYEGVVPLQKDGITFVPVRFTADSLGAKVDWNGKTRTVSVAIGCRSIGLKYGSDKMKAGRDDIKLSAPVWSVNGRMMVPMEQFVEALGRYAYIDGDIIIISEDKDISNVKFQPSLIKEIASRLQHLPVVGCYEKLSELIRGMENTRVSMYRDAKSDEAIFNGDISGTAAQSKNSKAETSAKEKAAADDYSSTNVQVQGVDEADVVKTDGEYIYQVNNQRIVAIKAYPANEMKIVSTITFQNDNFTPQELYLHGNKLVVTGISDSRDISGVQAERSVKLRPGYTSFGTVRTMIFDITDRANIKKIREIELDGSYVSSRKIDSFLYIIANKGIDPYLVQEKREGIVPAYRDTLLKNEFMDIGYDKIYYFPDMTECSYMITAALNLDSAGEPVKVSAYFGAGQNIYASQKNMYVAVTGYKHPEVMPEVDAKTEEASDSPRKDVIRIMPRTNVLSTLIYKFAHNADTMTYISKGEVPGTVLNQFSMDEDEDNFRIATTEEGLWQNDIFTSRNNLYVLDKSLKIMGKIEDIAPGERIYSVRFMGKRAYMVTFRTVDPLFVIDLKDSLNPRILGALKIPGYSDYLHPYDENHIIGFGKDTVEIKGGAYYQGMKVALFDVSDVSNPKQKFVEIIGDRGTDSELLRNHKALLFSKARNLMAFPITVMEVGDKRENELEYGRFAFQGAYVYSLDITSGFRLKGKITHLSEEDYLKSGDWGYYEDKSVERIMYIDDVLYTLSKKFVKAHGIDDIRERNSLEIP